MFEDFTRIIALVLHTVIANYEHTINSCMFWLPSLARIWTRIVHCKQFLNKNIDALDRSSTMPDNIGFMFKLNHYNIDMWVFMEGWLELKVVLSFAYNNKNLLSFGVLCLNCKSLLWSEKTLYLANSIFANCAWFDCLAKGSNIACIWVCLKFITNYNMFLNLIRNADMPILILRLKNPISEAASDRAMLFFF